MLILILLVLVHRLGNKLSITVSLQAQSYLLVAVLRLGVLLGAHAQYHLGRPHALVDLSE